MASNSDTSEGDCRIKWRNPEPTLINGFEKLFRAQTLTDVTLSCQGSTIGCHKIVLFACSSLFEKHLLKTECQHPIIEIDAGIQFEQLQRILDYMYTGEVIVPQNELVGFLQAAKKLEVKGLIENKPKSDEKQQGMTTAKPEPNGATLTNKSKKYKKYAEKDMASAIQAVKNGMSALAAARLHEIPARTLYVKLQKLGIPRLGNCPNAKLMKHLERREIPSTVVKDDGLNDGCPQNL